jgi:hypothetical protein
VEAVELEPAGGEPFGVRRLDRAAEGARRAEAGVVDEDDEDVRRSRGRTQRLDRSERGAGSLAS